MEGGYSQSLGKYNGKLNSIGNAHVQRLMKKNEEEKAEEVEAKFVDAMERIQTLELGMAVFAPRILSVMILSAIAAVSVNVEGHCVKDGTCNTGCDESDNDDDDVLLMTLGRKRQGHSGGIHQSSAKKHRGEKSISMPNSYCMARILSHISKTWGHLYWQPTQSENAWIKHCYQNGFEDRNKPSDAFEKSFTNSQKFPFELLHHTMNTDKLTEMNNNIVSGKIELQDELLITYLSSDVKTGVAKEMGYLRKCELIEVDNIGTVKLASAWETKVPAFILYDMMEEGWDTNEDRQNRFCLHEDFRNHLSMNWKLTNEGWARCDRPNKILYYHDVYTHNKQSFQDKWTDCENEMDGIAQFGI